MALTRKINVGTEEKKKEKKEEKTSSKLTSKDARQKYDRLSGPPCRSSGRLTEQRKLGTLKVPVVGEKDQGRIDNGNTETRAKKGRD